MGAVKFMGGIMMVALFSFALLMFAQRFANDNNSEVISEGSYNSTLQDLNYSMESYQSSANGSVTALKSVDMSAGADASSGASATDIDYTNMSTSVGNVAFTSIFGADSGFKPIFLTIMVFLGTVAGLYFWAVVKGGNVE